MSTSILHRRLEKLIGQRFDYLGEVWTLIEVLAELDSVVLQRCEGRESFSVQTNAYGQPIRRSDNTLTLPISDKTGGDFSNDLLMLLEGRQARLDDH